MRHLLCRFANAFAAVALLVNIPSASAQVTSKRLLHVTVAEPLNRFVVGLESENLQVIENGIRRVVTEFSDTGTPISLAIVSAEPFQVAALAGLRMC